MILILSESKDVSTDKIIEWLSFMNKDFVRYDYDSLIKDLKIEINNFHIKIKLDDINLDSITTVLIRRKEFRFSKD